MDNLVTLKREVGRPLKFQTPEELRIIIQEYFNSIQNETDITLTGLIIACGLSKHLFYEYLARPEFRKLLDDARMHVENSYERSLRNKGGAPEIFALKNFGWKDQFENVNTNTVELTSSDPEKLKKLLDAIT